MAASFGEKLLREVHTEGLDELFHDLRALHYESVESTRVLSHRFGVASIDKLLEAFIPLNTVTHGSDQPQAAQDESLPGQPGFESPQPQPATLVPPQTYSSRVSPVVEVSSTSSAAGKSQLLYYLAAIAVLPSSFGGIGLSGHESAVVFIDMDGRFDAERLRTVALGIVQVALPTETGPESLEPDGASVEDMIVSALQHVHVFRPQSSLSLLATLQSLDKYLLDLPRHVSSKRPLHSIMIDSATAFFWQDRLQDEIARIEDIGRPMAEVEQERRQKQSFYLADVYADLVTELKRLQRLFDCAVIYSAVSWTGRPADPGQYASYNPFDTVLPNLPAFRAPLPAPWGLFPTLRLVVQRVPVSPFPSAMTVDEARQDASMRLLVAMQGKFVGWVNGWGREDWHRRVVEGVKSRDGGRFTFCIGPGGVTF